jgi:hypothetical protein
MEVDTRLTNRHSVDEAGRRGACKTVDAARNVPTAVIDNTPNLITTPIDHSGWVFGLSVSELQLNCYFKMSKSPNAKVYKLSACFTGLQVYPS